MKAIPIELEVIDKDCVGIVSIVVIKSMDYSGIIERFIPSTETLSQAEVSQYYGTIDDIIKTRVKTLGTPMGSASVYGKAKKHAEIIHQTSRKTVSDRIVFRLKKGGAMVVPVNTSKRTASTAVIYILKLE